MHANILADPTDLIPLHLLSASSVLPVYWDVLLDQSVSDAYMCFIQLSASRAEGFGKVRPQGVKPAQPGTAGYGLAAHVLHASLPPGSSPYNFKSSLKN